MLTTSAQHSSHAFGVISSQHGLAQLKQLNGPREPANTFDKHTAFEALATEDVMAAGGGAQSHLAPEEAMG